MPYYESVFTKFGHNTWLYWAHTSQGGKPCQAETWFIYLLCMTTVSQTLPRQWVLTYNKKPF